jgi:hypothetical protein
MAINAQNEDADADGTLIRQGGGSGVNHAQAGAGARGEPTINPEAAHRGHLCRSLIPFEF